MKKCGYCGQENEDAALQCKQCGNEFVAAAPVDPKLTDPNDALVVVATFPDLIPATLLRDELELAGIDACIPEDLSANAFGHFTPLTPITVQVAARNFAAAKELYDAQQAEMSRSDQVPEASD